MLVIALIMIMIVGFAGVAVLTQQNSASKVQIVYASAQQRELAVRWSDRTVRSATSASTVMPESRRRAEERPVPTPALPGSTFGTLTWNGDDYEVYCAPAPTSGQAIAPTNGDRIVAISLCDPSTACAAGHVRLRTQVRLVDQPSIGTAVEDLELGQGSNMRLSGSRHVSTLRRMSPRQRRDRRVETGLTLIETALGIRASTRSSSRSSLGTARQKARRGTTARTGTVKPRVRPATSAAICRQPVSHPARQRRTARQRGEIRRRRSLDQTQVRPTGRSNEISPTRSTTPTRSMERPSCIP